MAKERSRAGYNRGSLTDVVKGMFKPGTEFRTGEGRLKSEFSPLSYGNKGSKGCKNPYVGIFYPRIHVRGICKAARRDRYRRRHRCCGARNISIQAT